MTIWYELLATDGETEEASEEDGETAEDGDDNGTGVLESIR